MIMAIPTLRDPADEVMPEGVAEGCTGELPPVVEGRTPVPGSEVAGTDEAGGL
jgi:hypothetical protein